ncbi:uncharacterized protein LOC125101853 [Lutra lutra]|uniref:uncharacterized protein LOC125101853 n=1 Tax=Lutra lutra TaxID=9657 RepID=UPI001FD2386C|nr:uncharacterized protein LOC125101853 [Lutra lutra]
MEKLKPLCIASENVNGVNIMETVWRKYKTNRDNALTSAQRAGAARRLELGWLRVLDSRLRGAATVGVAGRTSGPFPERYANDMQISACEPQPAVRVRPQVPRSQCRHTLRFRSSLSHLLCRRPLTLVPSGPPGTRLTGSPHRRLCRPWPSEPGARAARLQQGLPGRARCLGYPAAFAARALAKRLPGGHPCCSPEQPQELPGQGLPKPKGGAPPGHPALCSQPSCHNK